MYPLLGLREEDDTLRDATRSCPDSSIVNVPMLSPQLGELFDQDRSRRSAPVAPRGPFD